MCDGKVATQQKPKTNEYNNQDRFIDAKCDICYLPIIDDNFIFCDGCGNDFHASCIGISMIRSEECPMCKDSFFQMPIVKDMSDGPKIVDRVIQSRRQSGAEHYRITRSWDEGFDDEGDMTAYHPDLRTHTAQQCRSCWRGIKEGNIVFCESCLNDFHSGCFNLRSSDGECPLCGSPFVTTIPEE